MREIENTRENREETGDSGEEGFPHSSFILSTFSFFRSNPHFASLPTIGTPEAFYLLYKGRWRRESTEK